MLLALAHVLTSTFAASSPSSTFVQVTSDRFYANDCTNPLPYRAPFPTLPLARITELRRIPASAAAVAFTSDGTLHLLLTKSFNPLGLSLSPDSHIGVASASPGSEAAAIFDILGCGKTGCTASRCEVATSHCATIPTRGLTRTLGRVVALEIDGMGGAWLATSGAGLLHLTEWSSGNVATFSTFGNVVGNVTALAIHTDTTGAASFNVAVATTLAVYHSFNSTLRRFTRHELVGAAIDATPSALAWATEPNGELLLWIGHEWCLNTLHPDGTVDRISGTEGLPMANVTHLRAGSQRGELWVGTTAGVAFRRAPDAARAPLERRWRYFGGDAWLPGDDTVHSLAVTSAEETWVATRCGAALLRSTTMTLDDKAAKLLTRVPSLTRHLLVAAANLKSYGNTSTASIAQHDGDNDGLWTVMFVASQSFRFATTGSVEARELAWKHFDAIEFLHNVTRTRGFFARSFVKCGEAHGAGDGGICPGAKYNTPCGWVNSTVCYSGSCCWIWKRDTSSDEVPGHIFGLLLAHQLLAQNDDERTRVANLLCDSVEYIVDGGFEFIDPVTHKRTSWGYWSPRTLNGVPGKPDERGGNSLSMLGYLAAGALVCAGDAKQHTKFTNAFVQLVEEEHYDANAVNAIATSPLSMAFFDFRLVSMAFQTIFVATPSLLLLEEGATTPPGGNVLPLSPATAKRVRDNLRRSLMRYWNESGTAVNGENSAVASLAILVKAVFGPLDETANGADDDASIVWQLERYPIDPLVEWPTWRNATRLDAGKGGLNAQRLDVSFDRDWSRCPLDTCSPNKYATHVLPADEGAWLGDSVTEASSMNVDGGNGMVENAPSPWLMVHWWNSYNNNNHQRGRHQQHSRPRRRLLANDDETKLKPPQPQRTVMAFISTAISNWPRLAEYLSDGGKGAGTVNAVSIDNLYHFDPRGDPMLKPDANAIAEHTRIWIQEAKVQTYPMIGFGGNITNLRAMLLSSTSQHAMVATLVHEAVVHGFNGINIDFEPLTDVLDPDNNANARDALALVDYLTLLGNALHAVNKTLSLDSMAVTGACWTEGGHLYPSRDLLPCPWIRRLWDLSALSAVEPLDKIITMDTYTSNSSE